MLFALVLLVHATTPSQATLKAATEAWSRKDVVSCQTLSQDALNQGDLGVDETAQAWLLRGTCYALAGDPDRAQRSDAVAVRIKRDVTLPDGNAPSDDSWKQAVRNAPPPERSLFAKTAVDGADAIDVELVVDDLQIVKAAMLLKDTEEIARFPLAVSEAKHRVSGIPVDNLTLVLLDKHANAISKTNVAPPTSTTPTAPATTTNATNDVPPTTTTATPATTTATFAKPRKPATLLTILGGSALVLGMAGVVVSGVEVAGYGSEALDKGQAWLIGAGASSTVFLIGASLVVVDQGFD